MTRSMRRSIVTAVAGVVLGVNITFAQDPPPQPVPPQTQAGEPARGQRGLAQRPGGRQNLPPVGPMGQQQLQDYLDVHATIVAERQLQLTPEQYPNFVARLRKLQQTRRQQFRQRAQMLQELRGLVQGPGPFRDDVLSEKLKALDEFNLRAAQEARQAELELDGVLAPWQRVRFRLLEESLERQKIDLLMKLRPAAGGGATARQPKGPAH